MSRAAQNLRNGLCSNPQHKQQTSDSNLLYRLYDFIMVKYATDNVTSTPTQDNSDVDKVENGYANMPNTPKATDVMPILAEKRTGMYRFANPFSRDVYYVRECFPRYYALIIDLLLHHNTDIATITGTSDQLSFFDPKSVSLDVLKVGSYHIVDPRYPMETFDSF
ncbi:hypothetical protein PC129_g17860 [Phytophthora cactorum]|uniref:Uncharacterized protein n=1 Tax=Phytophthora cactorum TaxID=29920 RepID=A0A8T1HFT0_9STRA|nr:hypothetical protein PC129_g17860 [Phytophthora cactorum]